MTSQFERDVINAVLNDHLSLVPGIVSQYEEHLFNIPDDKFITDIPQEIEYTQEVLRIFCKPCATD